MGLVSEQKNDLTVNNAWEVCFEEYEGHVMRTCVKKPESSIVLQNCSSVQLATDLYKQTKAHLFIRYVILAQQHL